MPPSSSADCYEIADRNPTAAGLSNQDRFAAIYTSLGTTGALSEADVDVASIGKHKKSCHDVGFWDEALVDRLV